MVEHTRFRGLFYLIRNNQWVRVSVSIIIPLLAVISAYLEFKKAGLSLLFWVLCSIPVIVIVIVTIIVIVSIVREWIHKRQMERHKNDLFIDYQSRREVLTTLIDVFAGYEKAKYLAEKTKKNYKIKVVMILPEESGIGVILNIGKEEDLKIGTRLLVFQTDEYGPGSQKIEKLIGRVRVTYIQAGNNLSHAVFEPQMMDREFQSQMTMRLQNEKKIKPPENFAVPYIPVEVETLSIEDIMAFEQCLSVYRTNLFDSGLDLIVREETLQ